ncbi:hypothetical protein J8273_5136 [Carpediemonas membranifera]|uniref:Uncharacterized protein n=1 Tax=Carpediemonas membranifera TaxID=201153 RepID=A0A8J6E8N2_9EUKA|nr:hypothetical protein J8273_5136 [Carpediemonas membranifera]|eukprot:KAG9392155.1 hypothetical protein J8273_5136 [Carpediemonas membranifera]
MLDITILRSWIREHHEKTVRIAFAAPGQERKAIRADKSMFERWFALRTNKSRLEYLKEHNVITKTALRCALVDHIVIDEIRDVFGLAGRVSLMDLINKASLPELMAISDDLARPELSKVPAGLFMEDDQVEIVRKQFVDHYTGSAITFEDNREAVMPSHRGSIHLEGTGRLFLPDQVNLILRALFVAPEGTVEARRVHAPYEDILSGCKNDPGSDVTSAQLERLRRDVAKAAAEAIQARNDREEAIHSLELVTASYAQDTGHAYVTPPASDAVEFSDTDEDESDGHSEPAAMHGDGVPLPQTDQDVDVESDVDDTDTVGSLLQQLDDTSAGLDDVPESVRLLEQYEPLMKRLAEEREAREALEQANRDSEESQKRLEAELGQQKAEDQAIHQFTQEELARASEAGLEALADELEDNWAELVRRAEEATVELDRYVPLAALMVLFQRNNVTGALWTRINSTMMRYGGQKFITVPPLDLGLSPEMKAIINQHSPAVDLPPDMSSKEHSSPADVTPMHIFLRRDGKSKARATTSEKL